MKRDNRERHFMTPGHYWYQVKNEEQIPSPALLVYPERIEANIKQMLAIAGHPSRLRPHVKTHKMSAVVKLQQQLGIDKFKCATLAEAEMLAQCGAQEILLAMQPVGPHIGWMIEWRKRHPAVRLSTLVDSESVLHPISQASAEAGLITDLFLDLNVGMNRSGIIPGEQAARLYRQIHLLSAVAPRGLHVYDGHIRDREVSLRAQKCQEVWGRVQAFQNELLRDGLMVPAMVMGGSPTFPLHAQRQGIELSPGTTILWDEGYSSSFPEMPFCVAALLFTRIISKPGSNSICLDLGHKAVGAEMPPPRAFFLGLKDAVPQQHSEEHLVLELPKADSHRIGEGIYAIPRHICSTVVRYGIAHIIRDGRLSQCWKIEAQNRHLPGEEEAVEFAF